MRLSSLPALAVALALLAGCAEPRRERLSPPAAGFEATVARAWFDLLYDLTRDEKLSPPVASPKPPRCRRGPHPDPART